MATTYPIPPVPNQSGRVAIITGANAGLGFEASLALAAAGAKVIMACRSVAKGEEARRAIVERCPAADVVVAELDISSLASVRDFAARTLAATPRLDLLINNAGIMATPQTRSPDGFEMQFATNHLGHFLLTGLLLPLLDATTGSRVVAVSSIAARQGVIDFEDPMGEKHYDTWKAYNQSKLANLMFGLELQRRLHRAGSKTCAMIAHPGASTTNLFSTPGGGFVKRVFAPLTKLFLFQSAQDGVQPILLAALSPDATPGGYYGPSRMNEMKGPPTVAKIPPAANDQDSARQLWQLSCNLVGFSYLDSGAD